MPCEAGDFFRTDDLLSPHHAYFYDSPPRLTATRLYYKLSTINTMRIRGRLALLCSIVFGFLMAYIAKQSVSQYSFMPIILGLFAILVARICFWLAFLLWDIGVYVKNKRSH